MSNDFELHGSSEDHYYDQLFYGSDLLTRSYFSNFHLSFLPLSSAGSGQFPVLGGIKVISRCRDAQLLDYFNDPSKVLFCQEVSFSFSRTLPLRCSTLWKHLAVAKSV